MFWAEIWNIRIFYLKNCHFLVVKFSVYLNRRDFVMYCHQEVAGFALPGQQYSFMATDEIFSMVILSFPLIQEGHMSASGERMCPILVNCLDDYRQCLHKLTKSQGFLAPISGSPGDQTVSPTFRNSTSMFLNSHLWSKTAILKLNKWFIIPYMYLQSTLLYWNYYITINLITTMYMYPTNSSLLMLIFWCQWRARTVWN